MDEQKKPGMSKGCLVGLIVVGILVVVLLAIGLLGWFYKGDLVKYAVVTAVTQSKTVVAENQPEGVDTVYFNATVDAFVERLNAEEGSDLKLLSEALQTMQSAVGDADIDADDVEKVYEGIFLYYPDLKSLRDRPVASDDTLSADDTTEVSSEE